jgi:hypothetical protein
MATPQPYPSKQNYPAASKEHSQTAMAPRLGRARLSQASILQLRQAHQRILTVDEINQLQLGGAKEYEAVEIEVAATPTDLTNKTSFFWDTGRRQHVSAYVRSVQHASDQLCLDH